MIQFVLLFVMNSSTPAFLGEYSNIESCKNAIYEIYATQTNPPGKRMPELEESINLRISLQKNYVCVPKKKS